MPLPTDEHLLQVSKDLVEQLKKASGKHPGYRPAHAKGILLTGSFAPSKEASSLSSATHFNTPSTPVTVRFSSSTGIPNIPDTNANADPRGCAIRFHLGGRKHTDLITHSTPYFPTRTGEEFLELLKALEATASATESPTPIEKFLGSHPSALAFVQAPKPTPTSFATEAYYGVAALKFVNTEGKETYFRYRVVPKAGLEHLDTASLEGKSPEFLYEEIRARVEGGKEAAFELLAQIAEADDITDDATKRWPESRPLIQLGTVVLNKALSQAEVEEQQKYIIYDPIPRVEGIEPSADPLLEMRAAVYLVSGKERRAAK